MISSVRSSCACRRSRPLSRARPSSANAGDASSRTLSSSAAFTSTTTGHRLRCSATSSATLAGPSSSRRWRRLTASRPSASPCRPADAGEGLFLLGCRHGLALLIDRVRPEAVVWDPVTGCRATVAYPPEFTTDNFFRGTVLSTAAATADGDGQYMRPFKAILIRIDDAFHDGRLLIRVSMCVYESQTGKWGHTISTLLPCLSMSFLSDLPSVLVGNVLYGFQRWPTGILKFDLERHSLCVVRTPQNLHRFIDRSFIQVVRTQQDGELGLAVLYGLTIELWERKVTSSPHGGTVRWVIQRTIQLDNLLREPRMNMTHNSSLPSARILGLDEDSNVIYVSTYTAGAFAIRLDSMKFTKLFNVDQIAPYPSCHPYAGFYTSTGVPRLSTA